jgi:hypothetical protein
MTRQDLLFSSWPLRGVFVQREYAMSEEIDAVPAVDLLGSAEDALVGSLARKYSLNAPVLRQDATEVSHEEATLDVSHDHDRIIHDRSRPFSIPATRYTYHVPFTGDGSLFQCTASTVSFNPPRAALRSGELELVFVCPHDKTVDLKGQFEQALASVNSHLAWIARDVREFNEALPGKAQAAIARRRARLVASHETARSLGYPLRRRSDAPKTYAVPEVRRKAPTSPKPLADAAAPLEPALALEEYEHILSVIANMVLVMERSPAAFRTMDEEALRQHFLVQLNGQYEGQATGETFNFEGKTDILVRLEGKNIFIAECKFWSGPQSLDDAITQLLGYASWRDTKTAILLFNRSRRLTTVLNAIPGVVQRRPEFLRVLQCATETGFRYVLHHRDDPERELVLTVLAFEVPA